MYRGIQNQTLEVYLSLFASVAGVFIIVMQTATELNYFNTLYQWLAKYGVPDVLCTLIPLLLSFLAGSAFFRVLYVAMRWLRQKRWIRTYNECYLNGQWYHIHRKDSDPTYLRVGLVNIRQHFYDLDVEAVNYNLAKLSPEELEQLQTGSAPVHFDNQKKVTRWKYILSAIDEKGTITACYRASKKFTQNRVNRGIHDLHVVERDAKGYPLILQGTFGDICPSDSEGYIELHRSVNMKKHAYSDTEQAPQSWLDEVNRARKEVMEAEKRMERLKEFKDVIDLVHSLQLIATDRESASEIKVKGDADYVTAVDLEISRRVKEKLRELYPTYGFFSEEEAGELSDPCWILDPIDGTTNLMFDYRLSSISLGLYRNGQIDFGIVYNPYTNETFTAVRDEYGRPVGAWLNGREIHVNTRSIHESLIEFGAGSTRKAQADQNFSLACEIFKEVLDIRRICSSALDLCYIACGRIDGYFEQVLKPWDVAAGSLILEAAGGMITDYAGNPMTYREKTSVIASSNPELHEFLSKKIREHIPQ